MSMGPITSATPWSQASQRTMASASFFENFATLS